MDNQVIASLDMFFRAKTWKSGTARSTDVKVSGKIQWTLKRDPADNRLKATRYLVEEK